MLDLPAQPPPLQIASPDPALWSRYVGQYWSHGNGVVTIRVTDDQLMLDWNGWQVALQPLAGDRYIGRDTSLSAGFVVNDAGPARHLLIGLPGWSITFNHVDPTFVPNPESWKMYAGVYLLEDDLIDDDRTLVIRVVKDQLLFHLQGEDEVAGIPISDTALATRHGLFEFQSAADGAIASVTLEDEYTYVRSEGQAPITISNPFPC
jgi:hypothetical protein